MKGEKEGKGGDGEKERKEKKSQKEREIIEQGDRLKNCFGF